jgi:hypothetical protein
VFNAFDQVCYMLPVNIGETRQRSFAESVGRLCNASIDEPIYRCDIFSPRDIDIMRYRMHQIFYFACHSAS